MNSGPPKFTDSYSQRTLDAVTAALEPLRAYLASPSVNEIQINGPDRVFIRQGTGDTQLTIRLSSNAIKSAINIIASLNDREVGGKNNHHILSARLPGVRIEAVLPPVAILGPTMCIRRHASRVVSLDEYVSQGTMTQSQADLLSRIVKGRQNFLVAGGTYTGKTTLVNALIAQIPAHERLVVVEQIHELRIEQPNVVFIECDPEQGVTAERAVNTSMRLSPSRIVVGELRGAEAMDFLNACNTGHPGSCSTIHADSAVDALSRIEDLLAMSKNKLPYEATQRRIAQSLEWVIHIGIHDGKRKITQIVRLDGLDREQGTYHFTDFTNGESHAN